MNIQRVSWCHRSRFLVMLFVSLITAVSCITPPDPTPSGTTTNKWLFFRNGLGSIQESEEYYKAIGAIPAKDTFAKWKAANGFGANTGGTEARAIYYNAGDLAIGRDMNCRRREFGPFFSNGLPRFIQIACYVTNYGPIPGTPNFPNEQVALNDAIAAANGIPGGAPFATVAMEFFDDVVEDIGRPVVPPEVKFYVYGGDGNLAKQAQLDSDGFKNVPHICLPCHGGTYDSTNHAVTGASFLPFDIFSFRYGQSPYTQSDQEENFRKLNSFVAETITRVDNIAISDMIHGMYSGGVDTPGSTANDAYIPTDWRASQKARDLYTTIVKPFCRTCHIAARSDFDFNEYSEFESKTGAIRTATCVSHNMPNAEVPFKKFWATALPMMFLQDSQSGLGFQPPCVTVGP